MTESRDRSTVEREASAGDVESPKVADQQGGWVGPQSAGPAPAGDHDGSGADDQEAADWERARAWAASTPDWSEERWRKVNARLGYQVVSGRKSGPRSRRSGSGPGRAAGGGS